MRVLAMTVAFLALAVPARADATRATSVRFHVRPLVGETNVATAIELAFDRRGVRSPHAPIGAIRLTLRWAGPSAGRRPLRMRLGPRGVYVARRLFALDSAVWCYVTINLPPRTTPPERSALPRGC
jgi:hypothetical protein